MQARRGGWPGTHAAREPEHSYCVRLRSRFSRGRPIGRHLNYEHAIRFCQHVPADPVRTGYFHRRPARRPPALHHRRGLGRPPGRRARNRIRRRGGRAAHHRRLRLAPPGGRATEPVRRRHHAARVRRLRRSRRQRDPAPAGPGPGAVCRRPAHRADRPDAAPASGPRGGDSEGRCRRHDDDDGARAARGRICRRHDEGLHHRARRARPAGARWPTRSSARGSSPS